MDIKLKDNSQLRLGYPQLEYIESTGTQWIDIGIDAQVTDDFDIEYQFTLLGNDEKSCFGIHGISKANMIMRAGWWWGGNSKYHYAQGETKHTLSKRGSLWILDGNTLSYQTNTGNIPSGNWALFTAPSGTDYTTYASSVKIYHFKLYRSGNLLRKFVPIDLNGITCLYDTVSGTFFYNKGTGDFIAGPVVKSRLPENILPKITTLYHKNTPNVDGLELLRFIIAYSKDNQDEIKYNHYKDSQLWNDIKTTYPDLIPYTDACHEMLSDICTCITPGPMQLASSCNDIINEGLVVLEYVETTNNNFTLTLFDSFNQSRDCKYFIKFKGSTESTPFDIGVRNQDQGDEYELFGNNGNLYFDYRGRTSVGSQAPANTVLNFEVGNKYVKNRDNDTFIINATAVTAEITEKPFKIQVKRLYEFQMYINDVLVSNLIPVQGGKFYDVVRGVIYNIPNYVDGPVSNITNFIRNCTYDDTLITIINRVRVDIGNVSGSLFELMQYSTLNGFNDAYEPQIKPRLVGTWTVNDWHTQEQLTQAQAAFDGLTVVSDPNYLINFDDLAVQTLDSTKPNYNPAVAIILQTKGKGTTLDVSPSGQGRYMLTKSQASSITSIGTWFSGVKNPYDSNGIVSSDTTLQYSFNDFIELKYFTGVSTLSGAVFQNCSNLTRLGISKNLVNFGDRDGSGGSMNLFTGCTSLNAVYYYGSVNDWFKINFYCVNTSNLHSNPLIYAKHLYINDEILEHIVIDDLNITSLKKMVFMNNIDIESVIVNSPITNIGYAAFNGCTNLKSIQINNENIDKRFINIDGSSFASCTSLNSISFNNVYPKSILTAAFRSVPYKFTNNDLLYLETYGSGLANDSTISNWDDYITLPNIVTFYTKYGNFGSTPLMLTLGENLTSFILQRYVDSKFHLLCSNPPSVGNVASVQTGAKIYVGDGSSAAHDNAILSTYANTTGYWQDLYNANGLDTWYNYLHPQA